MRRTRFLIPGLLAAGFGQHDGAVANSVPTFTTGNDDPNNPSLFRVFKQDHTVTLAQHRSHRSHSSHSSHRSGSGGHYSHTSHRSSTGGGYSAPAAPVYSAPAPTRTPTPPPRLVPLRSAQPGEATPPRTDSLPALSGRTARFKAIVKRVQIGLLAQGFYTGSIDGVVGPNMRAALRKFQKARGLPVTGTITSETLDALRITSD